MIRVIIRTKSVQLKSHNDITFSAFVDHSLLRFNHEDYDKCPGIFEAVDFNTKYYSSRYGEYYYSGGTLTISISNSDGNIVIDWLPNDK